MLRTVANTSYIGNWYPYDQRSRATQNQNGNGQFDVFCQDSHQNGQNQNSRSVVLGKLVDKSLGFGFRILCFFYQLYNATEGGIFSYPVSYYL